MKRVAVLLSGIVLWLLLSETGLVSPLYLPSPTRVIAAARLPLAYGCVTTTARAIVATVVGVLLAYSVHFAALRIGVLKALDANLASSRAIPSVAILPLFVLWFGFSEFGRSLFVALSAWLYFAAPLHAAFWGMPKEWVLLRQQLAMKWVSFYCYIVVPGTLASILGALRLTLALAFSMSVASEYLGADSGIGKVIDNARITFNVPAIFLSVICAAAIGLILDKMLCWLHELVFGGALVGAKY